MRKSVKLLGIAFAIAVMLGTSCPVFAQSGPACTPPQTCGAGQASVWNGSAFTCVNIGLSQGASTTQTASLDWANTSYSLNCPAGSIVTGINITLGGTCNHQCNSGPGNPDAPPVRTISVTCTPLVSSGP